MNTIKSFQFMRLFYLILAIILFLHALGVLGFISVFGLVDELVFLITGVVGLIYLIILLCIIFLIPTMIYVVLKKPLPGFILQTYKFSKERLTIYYGQLRSNSKKLGLALVVSLIIILVSLMLGKSINIEQGVFIVGGLFFLFVALFYNNKFLQ